MENSGGYFGGASGKNLPSPFGILQNLWLKGGFVARRDDMDFEHLKGLGERKGSSRHGCWNQIMFS